MLPFPVEIKPGEPVSGQMVYAVKKAIISGLLRPGDKFPSVRVLSQELRVNPNTAHKVIALLVQEKLIEVRPGIGTVVAEDRAVTRRQRSELLGAELERLVVEAKNLRIELDDMLQALERHWNKLSEEKKK
jgi:DNA-binding transcriptional regulator YhcF (GntR family)